MPASPFTAEQRRNLIRVFIRLAIGRGYNATQAYLETKGTDIGIRRQDFFRIWREEYQSFQRGLALQDLVPEEPVPTALWDHVEHGSLGNWRILVEYDYVDLEGNVRTDAVWVSADYPLSPQDAVDVAESDILVHPDYNVSNILDIRPVSAQTRVPL